MTSTTSRKAYGVKGAPYAHPSPATTLKRARGAPYLFLLPATLLFALFFALPIGYAVWLSFRKAQVSGLGLGSGARKEVWAGFENYTEAFQDSELLHGALRVLGYGCIVVPTMLGLALLFALMLDTLLLYTSDAADDLLCVDLGGRRIIKKKKIVWVTT